jgi:hypothetical protein
MTTIKACMTVSHSTPATLMFLSVVLTEPAGVCICCNATEFVVFAEDGRSDEGTPLELFPCESILCIDIVSLQIFGGMIKNNIKMKRSIQINSC